MIIASWMSFINLCIAVIQKQWWNINQLSMMICLKHILFRTTLIYFGFRIGQKGLMRLCLCKISKGARDRVTWHRAFSLSFRFSLLEEEQEVHWSLLVIAFLIELKIDILDIALQFFFCFLRSSYLPLSMIFSLFPYNIIFLPLLAILLHPEISTH